MEKHLKPKQYYIDLYDRHTVEQCRRTEKIWNKEEADLPKDKKVSKKQMAQIKSFAHEWYMHIEMGERYLNKEKIIREWMDSDQKKDDLYESAQAPEDIRCLTCRNRVIPTFKELWSELDKPDRVLFMYDCPNKCMPRRAFFSDGEEWRVKPHLCLHCSTPLDEKIDDDGKRLLTTRTCPKCKYAEKDELVWSVKKEKELDEDFAKDRDRFCMTEEEGRKFQDEKWNLEQLAKFSDEWKEKEKLRDEKLKANPKGFHLEGAGYTCFICGGSTPEGDNWYDEYGIKCLICQKAIDNNEIPGSLAKFKDSWYTKWELERSFGIKSPTLRKWVKEGILKARTVSHYGQGVHTQLFLIKDNKDFLPPKKLVESRGVKERKDGKDYYTTRDWYQFVDPYKHLKGYKILDYLKFTPIEENKTTDD
jgi:hypothetical protein